MSSDVEQLIIEQAKKDPQAFGVIFDRYYPKILAYTVRRTGSVITAEEIVSETFVKALQALRDFRWRGISIEAWLFRIAINELKMHFRNSRPTASLDEMYETSGFEPVSDYDLAQEALDAQERLAGHKQFIEARRIMARLPSKYQDVLLLRYVEQKKIREIAQIIDKNENTVKSLLSRGLERLRVELRQKSLQPKIYPRIIKRGRD
jgi:RNA polymerase sigma-70 factor (ECF subfamily)